MNKPLCIVSSPVDTFSGYGARSRDFIKSLIKAKGDEWDIKLLSQRWGSTPFGFLNDEIEDEADLKLRIIGTGNFLDDINNISNPDGVILASNFTNGAIFEAYCSGQFTIPGGSSGANPSKVAFRLTFNPLTAPANTSFGQTEVNTSINSLDVQTFEYRCTFRVVSYTNTTINITFVTSGQCARSGASGVSATFQLNQTSADNIQKITKDRTLDGNINLAICIYNISDYNLNISRYTSYIKRIV